MLLIHHTLFVASLYAAVRSPQAILLQRYWFISMTGHCTLIRAINWLVFRLSGFRALSGQRVVWSRLIPNGLLVERCD